MNVHHTVSRVRFLKPVEKLVSLCKQTVDVLSGVNWCRNAGRNQLTNARVTIP